VRDVSPTLGSDRPLAEDIARVTELLQTEAAQQHCLAPANDAHED
jgi:histidine ammonia-lyase